MTMMNGQDQVAIDIEDLQSSNQPQSRVVGAQEKVVEEENCRFRKLTVEIADKLLDNQFLEPKSVVERFGQLFLMLQNELAGNDVALLNIQDSKVSKSKFIEAPHGLCVGSHKGWFLMVDDSHRRSFNIFKRWASKIKNFLYNPFTNETIELPSQTKMPYSFSGHRSFLRKLVLSSDVTEDNIAQGKCVVVVLINDGILAFCKPGDRSWTILDDPRGMIYTDMIFFGRKLYAIKINQEVRVFDVFCNELQSVAKILPSTWKRPAKTNWSDLRNFLVESEGRLLMVLRLIQYFSDPNYLLLNTQIQTIGFKVYELNFKELKWSEELESLGDQVLFLGVNCSKSFSMSDFPGIKGNSIYFTDDNLTNYSREELCWVKGLSDYGVFSLDEKIIKPYLPKELLGPKDRAIWVECPIV